MNTRRVDLGCRVSFFQPARLLVALHFISILATPSLLFFSPGTARAGDKLGVAIPYPIARIDPLDRNEPLNAIILSNTSVGLTSLDESGFLFIEG